MASRFETFDEKIVGVLGRIAEGESDKVALVGSRVAVR
jgi:hypothetical protein